jgi:hypothetical protein
MHVYRYFIAPTLPDKHKNATFLFPTGALKGTPEVNMKFTLNKLYSSHGC